MQTQDRSDQLFERLCLYRAIYERRGPLDSTSAISIQDAIRWAVELMSDAELFATVLSRRD
jgi:hypothetical protein